MPKPSILYPPELIARAREVHMRGATQEAVGVVLGCSQQTAGRRIREWGWPRVRGSVRPRPKFRFVASDYELAGEPSAAGAEARSAAEQGEPDKHLHRPAPRTAKPDLPKRLRELVAREMKRVEICGGPPAEVARTLAALARTLKLLHALPGGQSEPDEDDGGTFDVDAFERELAAHIQEMRNEDIGRVTERLAEEFAARFARDAGARLPG